MFSFKKYSLDFSSIICRGQVIPYANLSLVINGVVFNVNSLIASSLCDYIRHLLMEDPLLEKIEMNADGSISNTIVEYLTGKEVSIKQQDFVPLLSVSCSYGMTNLIKYILDHYKIISYHSFFEMAYLTMSKGYSIEPFIDELAQRKDRFGFQKNKNSETKNQVFSAVQDIVKKSKLTAFDAAFLDIVLRTRILPFDSKEIVSLISNFFNILKDPNHRLIEYYPLGDMDANLFKKLVSNPTINLNRLRSAIPNASQTKKDNNEYDFSAAVDIRNGIMRSKIHPVITQSGTYDNSDLSDTLLTENGFLRTQPAENESFASLTFTFEDHQIQLHSYVLGIQNQFIYGIYPKKWRIEGSIDSQWVEIETREFILESYPFHHCFVVKPGQKFYSAIKITQLESNITDCSDFILSEVEFFGEVI